MLIWQDNEFDTREADARIDNSGPSDCRENVPLPVFLVMIIGFGLLVAAIGEAIAGSVTR